MKVHFKSTLTKKIIKLPITILKLCKNLSRGEVINKTQTQRVSVVWVTLLKWNSFKGLNKDISPLMGKCIYFLGAVTYKAILPWWRRLAAIVAVSHHYQLVILINISFQSLTFIHVEKLTTSFPTILVNLCVSWPATGDYQVFDT